MNLTKKITSASVVAYLFLAGCDTRVHVNDEYRIIAENRRAERRKIGEKDIEKVFSLNQNAKYIIPFNGASREYYSLNDGKVEVSLNSDDEYKTHYCKIRILGKVGFESKRWTNVPPHSSEGSEDKARILETFVLADGEKCLVFNSCQTTNIEGWQKKYESLITQCAKAKREVEERYLLELEVLNK